MKVWDPTNESYIPRGKQVKNPHAIWYTPVSGIWQTVWLEPVSSKYISNVVSVADIDNKNLKVKVWYTKHYIVGCRADCIEGTEYHSGND